MGKLSLILIFLASPAMATIYETSVGEIRATATSGNVNGGFFDPVIAGVNGVDYSQQDVAVSSSTAWASTIGTTDPSFVTLSGFTPSLALIGNAMHCTAGTSWNTAAATAYHIIIGTDTNGVYIHGAAGSAATLSGGTCYIGGAASLGAGSDLYYFRAALGTNGVGGTKIWWKKGSYTMGAALSTLATCGTQAPCVIEGYQTTRGDLPSMDNAPVASNGATNQSSLGANWKMKFVDWIGGGVAMFNLAANDQVIGCRITNNSTTATRTALVAYTNTLIMGCDICSYRGKAITETNVAGVRLIGNYIHDSDMGIIFGTTQAGHTVINNLFVGNYSIGLNISTAWTNGFVFYGNTFYGAENKLGVGMNIFTGTTGSWYLNNIFYGFTTGISMPDTPNDMYSDYNDFYNNGTNTLNIDHKPHDLFVNPQFANVHQLVNTGTVTAGASDLTLTDTGQNFSSVVAGSDFIDIISGVNVTTGTYGIVTVAPGADTTKIVLDLDPTPSSTGSSIVYSLTTGRNFATGPNVWAQGFPEMFNDYTPSDLDIGAVNHRDAPRAYAQ